MFLTNVVLLAVYSVLTCTLSLLWSVSISCVHTVVNYIQLQLALP